MKQQIRRNARLAVAATALSVLGAFVAPMASASADTSTTPQIPAPAGMTLVPTGQTTTFDLGDGETATVTAGAPTEMAHPGNTDTSKPTTTKCWSVTNNANYSFSGVRFMAYNQQVNWCGNGIDVVGTPGQNIYGTVTGSGTADGWSYDGVLASSSTEFYGGQAWQLYTQGKFSECYLHFGCTGIYKYPRLTTNVYKDGATNLYESY